MSDDQIFYLTPYQNKWQLKKVGGVKVLRSFPDRSAALAFVQVMMSKQHASIRIQSPDGTWQAM